ncbi:MAG: FAD-dependent oxidoreductase [Desulfuromonadaceae bacterium]
MTQYPYQRWKLTQVSLSLEQDEAQLPEVVAQILKVQQSAILNLKIMRRGIDARRKRRILRVYTIAFDLPLDVSVPVHLQNSGTLQPLDKTQDTRCHYVRPSATQRIVVAGMGPSGLFAALELAHSGHSVTLLERGAPVAERVRDVETFWSGGALNPQSNVQFGEGGAGTFSDGKLTTRIKHPLAARVMETFVACGASEDIRIDAKPHIGTDVLRTVLVNLRSELRSLGVEIRYHSQLTDLEIEHGCVKGVVVNASEQIHCDAVVLAVGHSARDTYTMLYQRGIAMEPKPFAVGVRVEHPASLINSIQYGMESHPRLPTAEYALSWNDRNSGRGVYSFCMCPGGEVVLSSSEEHGVVVNGMSHSRRAGDYSNSALVVGVKPQDFEGHTPLAGVEFQRFWEQKAYAGNGDYRPPAQNMLSFLQRGYAPVNSTCRPGVREEELREYLPAFVYAGLQQALPSFERKMRGFISTEASIIGLETRTSAPLRILRTSGMESVNCNGLYPVGEGAGYAGGIMSAALDGLKVVQAINEQTHVET